MTMRVREINYFVAWLLFWVSATVCGFLAGAIAGAIVGAILGGAGVALVKIKMICGVVGFFAAMPFSYLLFRLIVGWLIVRKVEETLGE